MKQRKDNLVVSVVGAAGKMGSRVATKIPKAKYDVLFCEEGEGKNKIFEMGVSPTEIIEAIPKSDLVVLAIPDSKIGEVSQIIVPSMKSNATMILLDPAAAYAGELITREDCCFVVMHPCHPSLFRDWNTPQERDDLFGGEASSQDIVIALIKGSETSFEIAKQICTEMFAPVGNVHRITVDQMALLEPAATEVIAATAVCIMKEAMNEAIKRGVPENAARAFMLGHIQVELAIIFGRIPGKFSDAADLAVELGRTLVFKSNWKDVFRQETLKKIVHEMLHPEG